MNLANLILENFGKFKNFECSFSPGLNVIKGANETGKSTLVEAICKLLYDDPVVAGEDSHIMGKTWGTEGSQVIKANINSDNFTGILEKDFDTGKSKLANQELNITLDDNDRINEVLTGAIGFSSAELFEATSCIKQGDISQIDRSIKAIKDKLESMVTGGKEDLAASQIIAKIDQRIEDISRRDDANPGLIFKLDKVQVNLDYNIEKIGRETKNIKSWRNSLGQVEMAYSNGTEDYRINKEKLDKALKAEQASIDLEKLTKEKDEIDSQLEEVKAEALKIRDLSTQLRNIIDIKKDDLKQIDDMESTLKYLKPKHRDLEKEVGSQQKACDEIKTGGAPIVLMLISIGGVGFGIADYIMRFTEFFYQISFGGLALLIVSLVLLMKNNQKKAFLKEQLKSEQKKMAEAAEEIEKITGELKELFDKYEINSADEVHQASWKRSEMENQLKSFENSFVQLLDGLTEEEIEIKAQELEKKVFDTKIILENYEVQDRGDLERLKLIVGQLEEQKNNLENELMTLNRQIGTAEGGSELLASYLERKEALSADKIKLVEELAVLGLTKECIEKARQNVMISTLEFLEKRTSEILEVITNFKYKKVRFDETSLKFKVFSDEKDDWVDPHHELSQATIEQIYLTARLALTEILGDKAKPPIILDDTFDRFDPERHDGTMKLLKQMAEDRQILLLTSDDNYDKWADKTIQL
ncbi:MAG: AAA family ATPase [candidate division Zixibacteria bacterium]|nr:AAA family ATPase [candidate division Zixibacteria bacterium]